ncbi:DMT family transporter [Sphingomonas sp. MMS24-JH45]
MYGGPCAYPCRTASTPPTPNPSLPGRSLEEHAQPPPPPRRHRRRARRRDAQPPTNAALAKASGSVWLAALISFSIGTAVLLVVWAFDRTPLSAAKGAPWWAWLGG